MAAGSLRCVAIAYRACKGETVPTDEEELGIWQMPEDDLVLLAIVGLKVLAGLDTFHPSIIYYDFIIFIHCML